MPAFPTSPLCALGVALLIGGLLAGALTGCGVRQRRQAAETATAAAGAASNATTAPAVDAASATPDNYDDGEALDSELEALSTELSGADTLDDLATELPPDGPTATPMPAAGDAATVTPAPNPTTAGVEADQGAEIEAMLAALEESLSQTDTVGEAANP